MSKAAVGQLRILSNSHRVGSFGVVHHGAFFFSICLRSYLLPQWNMTAATKPPHTASQSTSSQSALEKRTIMKFPVGKEFAQYARAFLVGALIGALCGFFRGVNA
jgi:hypothetical protein